MRKFAFNEQAAREADAGGKRITAPGVYTGRFTQAWYEKNQNGTEGVFLTFAADNGQQTTVRLYTHNSAGEELPSYKTLNAIMAVLRLKGIEAKPGKVVAFDGEQDVEKAADIFPTMLNKPIGLMLQTEEYTNSSGAVKNQINIFAPFCPEKRATASEIIDKKVDGELVKLLERFEQFKHKSLSGRRGGTGSSGKPAATKSTFEEDDIPF